MKLISSKKQKQYEILELEKNRLEDMNGKLNSKILELKYQNSELEKTVFEQKNMIEDLKKQISENKKTIKNLKKYEANNVMEEYLYGEKKEGKK